MSSSSRRMGPSLLPEIIKIDDISSGKIDPKLFYQEIDRLKVEINLLRSDMTLFLQALSTIPPSQSQGEYYDSVVTRLKVVQSSIREYCAQYNRLVPVINLAQIRLGHEVEIVTPKPGVSRGKGGDKMSTATTTGTNASATATTGTTGTTGSAAKNSQKKGNHNPTKDKNHQNGSTAHQPIEL